MTTSVATSKSTFLTSQIRLLSTPLAPSSAFTASYVSSNPWKRKAPGDENDVSNITESPDVDASNITTGTNDTTTGGTASHDANSNNREDREGPTITPKQIEEITVKVNAKILTHNKTAFPSLTQRLIVEQIESLYLNSALKDYALDDDDDEHTNQDSTAIQRNTDLTDSAVIPALPGRLEDTMLGPSRLSAGKHRQRRQRYSQLLSQLQQLTQQRDELQHKFDRYVKLKALLEPFAEPKENIQPNLVGMRGQGQEEGLAREMERVRVLVARVLGGLEGKSQADLQKLGGTSGEKVSEEGGRTTEERLKMILEMGVER
jgi:hypothetical protein